MDTLLKEKDFRLQMARENEMDGYEKMDLYNQETIDKLSFHYKEILKLIGENPGREL